jgi:hypothetical protein
MREPNGSSARLWVFDDVLRYLDEEIEGNEAVT